MKIDISPSLGRVSHDVAPTPAASLTNLQALAQQAVATGLDRPGKSVNAIRPNDPESETNRVLIKFTMPMPEIKGDNEDDEVEMPTGLPMSVPMYVDVPAGSAPDSAGTVLDAAVDAGDARGAALTRVPPHAGGDAGAKHRPHGALNYHAADRSPRRAPCPSR
ncbi:hypothetical protein [Achromobacter xylosoxidans]|uniref:hypothetical protein n=1 Tax=Alcaligenes xylosoxydans xylosoxydans TaxID=85698 RepID=UPI00192AE2EC|nr:hypothetical protein [Achromobacter xylosoxidans]